MHSIQTLTLENNEKIKISGFRYPIDNIDWRNCIRSLLYSVYRYALMLTVARKNRLKLQHALCLLPNTPSMSTIVAAITAESVDRISECIKNVFACSLLGKSTDQF